MSLLAVVLTLVVIGVLLWLLFKYVPMAEPIPTIIKAVVIIAVVLWLLSISGLLPGLGRVPFPHK